MYELNTIAQEHSNGGKKKKQKKNKVKIFSVRTQSADVVQNCANVYISLTGPILFCMRGVEDRV